MRNCAKTRCGSEAVTTLSLRYDVREVLIRNLTPEHDPNFLDLCSEHAEGLTPPRGWLVRDERVPVSTPGP